MSHKADTSFDWAIYADATFAGLSILIPLIVIDRIFEEFFRRRMVATIAGKHGVTLPADIRLEINRNNWGGKACLKSCLLLPVMLVFWLVKRISRKILYFLTVKESAEGVGHYWQRAFLINHALLSGHLDSRESAQTARLAFEQVIQIDPSGPVNQLAWQVVTGVKHILRTLHKAWYGTEDPVIAQTQAEMERGWLEFEAELAVLAQNYEQAYRQIAREKEEQNQQI